MADDKHEPDQPRQKTPQGHEIPVPTRKQVFRDLEKSYGRNLWMSPWHEDAAYLPP
jgi:hypothetical protein